MGGALKKGEVLEVPHNPEGPWKFSVPQQEVVLFGVAPVMVVLELVAESSYLNLTETR